MLWLVLCINVYRLVLQALKSPQPKTGSQQAFKPLPDIVKGLAAVEGEVPIMMPAKLATNKVRSRFPAMRLCPLNRSAASTHHMKSSSA